MRKAETETPDTRLGYEPRDIALSTIIRWIIVLFIFAGVASATSYVIFSVLSAQTAVPPGIPFTQRRPPEPRIQTQPRIDLHTFRAEEDHALHSYRWIDKNAGVAAIPVDQAIDILAARGLPTPNGPVTPAPGTPPTANAPTPPPPAPPSGPPTATESPTGTPGPVGTPQTTPMQPVPSERNAGPRGSAGSAVNGTAPSGNR